MLTEMLKWDCVTTFLIYYFCCYLHLLLALGESRLIFFFYSTTNPLSVQLFHFIDFLFAAIYGCRSLSIICIHINLSVHLVSEKKDATINFESSS